MKLFSIVLLAIAAIARAVPAPLAQSMILGFPTPEPLFEINISPSMANDAVVAGIPYMPYLTFTLQVTETCSYGEMFTSALWIHHDFQKQVWASDINPVTIKLNGKLLGILYKAPPSVVEYEYDGCRWTSSSSSSIGNSYCGMSNIKGSWTRSPLSCSGAEESRRAIWVVSVKGGYPDIETGPHGASNGTDDPKHIELDTTIVQPAVEAKPAADLSKNPTIASVTSLERREEYPPWEACHRNCETQRRYLAEYVRIKLTQSQGGHDYERIKDKYDACCTANKKAEANIGTMSSKVATIGARDAEQDLAPINVTDTDPAWSLNPSKALVQDSKIGYFPFSVSVTEYCEATEGTPLKARGYFAPEGENGLNLQFDNGDLVYSIPIGWGNLLVGGYDYWSHRLHFHYNGCHWDQATDGWQKCGFCKSRPWTSGALNCVVDPGAGRNHGIDCMVAVAYE